MSAALVILVLFLAGFAGRWTGIRVGASRWSATWLAAVFAPPILAALAISAWLYRDQLWPAPGTLPPCRPGAECFGYGMFFSGVLLVLLVLAWSIGFWRGRRSGPEQGGNP